LIHGSNKADIPGIMLGYPLIFVHGKREEFMQQVLEVLQEHDYVPGEPGQEFKICVNTGERLTIYNRIIGDLEERDVIIRFGLKI